MKNITLLTGIEYSEFKRSRQDPFFPLKFFKRQLLEEGFVFKYFLNHSALFNSEHDIVILPNRYFYHRKFNIDEITIFLEKLRKFSKKIIWFDMGDSSGSFDFELLKLVDLFWKKQILKDNTYYTNSTELFGARNWIKDIDYRLDEGLQGLTKYSNADPKELYKLKVCWNIAFTDYIFNENKFLDLFNNFKIKAPTYNKNLDRPYVIINRGTIGKNNIYNFQRNTFFKVLEKLKSSTNFNIINGGFVSRKKYINELEKSKFIFSPFGWGEICYRDFEAFLSGNILIKSDMDGIETWPNLFKKNITYLPIDYELNHLESLITNSINDYNSLSNIQSEGVNQMFEIYKDSGKFINHFKSII